MAKGGKSVHCGCMHTYVYVYTHMYVCTHIHTYTHAVTKWSIDRLHSYCSAQQFSMVWVMLRVYPRIEHLWAMLYTGLTASASSFLLLSFLRNALEAIHAEV